MTFSNFQLRQRSERKNPKADITALRTSQTKESSLREQSDETFGMRNSFYNHGESQFEIQGQLLKPYFF